MMDVEATLIATRPEMMFIPSPNMGQDGARGSKQHLSLPVYEREKGRLLDKVDAVKSVNISNIRVPFGESIRDLIARTPRPRYGLATYNSIFVPLHIDLPVCRYWCTQRTVGTRLPRGHTRGRCYS